MASDYSGSADKLNVLSWAIAWRYFLSSAAIGLAIGAAQAFLIDGVVAIYQRLTIGHSTPFDQPLWMSIGFNVIAGLLISFFVARVLLRWAIGKNFAGAVLRFDPRASQSKEHAA